MVASRLSNADSEAPARSAKLLLDDLQQRQLHAVDALRRKIVGPHGIGAVLFEQRRHLFVGNGGAGGGLGHYCTTKLVNSTSSTSGPPSFFCTARISASASWRSFSLPSRDIID